MPDRREAGRPPASRAPRWPEAGSRSRRLHSPHNAGQTFATSIATFKIGVVVDVHFALAFIKAVQPAHILRDRSMPGDRERQEQRIQPGVVKPFADVAARRQQHALFVAGNGGKLGVRPIEFRFCSSRREARPGDALRATSGRPAHRDGRSARSERSAIARLERPATTSPQMRSLRSASAISSS